MDTTIAFCKILKNNKLLGFLISGKDDRKLFDGKNLHLNIKSI